MKTFYITVIGFFITSFILSCSAQTEKPVVSDHSSTEKIMKTEKEWKENESQHGSNYEFVGEIAYP